MDQKQFMDAKMQLEERERLQKRVQELDELINGEKEILMKKNVPVEQMLKYLGYEKLTREMLEEYVQGIYVYDDGRVEVEWRALKLARWQYLMCYGRINIDLDNVFMLKERWEHEYELY